MPEFRQRADDEAPQSRGVHPSRDAWHAATPAVAPAEVAPGASTPAWPDLGALGALVMQLHRGARAWPTAGFQPRACELVLDLLPADVVVWGGAPATAPPAVAAQDLYVQGLAGDGLARYLAGGHAQDPLQAAAAARPGIAVVAGAGDAFLAGYGMGGALCVSQLDPLAARRLWIGLWRRAGAPAWTEAERQSLQFLAPHLFECRRENLLGRGAAEPTEPAPQRSHGVAGTDGLLQQLDERCLALLRLEWPRWSGPRLPPPLLPLLAAAEPASHAGRHVTVDVRPCGAARLLEVRRSAPVDRLSARQRGIAELYAAGLTCPQIAERLDLSPSTVNNHLGVVFRKLGVNNKLQLLRLMPGAAA